MDIQCHSAILRIMEVIFIVNHVVFNTVNLRAPSIILIARISVVDVDYCYSS